MTVEQIGHALPLITFSCWRRLLICDRLKPPRVGRVRTGPGHRANAGTLYCKSRIAAALAGVTCVSRSLVALRCNSHGHRAKIICPHVAALPGSVHSARTYTNDIIETSTKRQIACEQFQTTPAGISRAIAW